MNDAAVINGQLPAIKEWNGQRVVTFKDIDLVHGRTKGTARQNFNRNKKHFIENEDYFMIDREQSNVSNCHIGSIPPKGLTLLTESGYLMVVKSFTDDLSWEVQRRLVNSYFKQESKQELIQGSEIDMSKALVKNKPKTWYEKNQWKMKVICDCFGWERKYLYHKMLTELSEVYNMEFFEEMFVKETGKVLKYKIQLIEFYPMMQDIANRYLDFLLGNTGE